MSAGYRANRRERAVALGAAVVVQALLLAALVFGLRVGDIARVVADPLAAFNVVAPTPPAAPVLPARAAGAAGAPNLSARPKPVVAPISPQPVASPPTAAPVAAEGFDTRAGAAPTPGIGTGAGGVGSGLGAGGAGNRARLIAGRIANKDYPGSARRARAMGSATVQFTVTPQGRVAGCRIVGSSGNAALDAATCTLITKRFRYAPATDAAGRPTSETRAWRQDWWLERGGV